MTEIDLTPITRLEYDIDAILNDHAVAEPITRIELILADIVAGYTTTVVPVTRIETYLAIISGADYPVPEPVTRIETFLAIIAGEDYEKPEAVTRLEGLLAEWVEKGSGIWKTVTGTLIHLTDALASPVQALSVAIEPQQSGTGDPSPTNVRPITGWTGCNIFRTGVNIFDGEMENGDISETTGQNNGTSSSRYRSKNYIPVAPGEYKLYFNSPGRTGTLRVFLYDESQNYIAYENWNLNAERTVNFIHTKYIRFRYGTGKKDGDSQISINIPSTVTEYVPYVSNTYPISWQTEAGTVYGGTLDVVNGTLTSKLKKFQYSSVSYYGTYQGNPLYYANIPDSSTEPIKEYLAVSSNSFLSSNYFLKNSNSSYSSMGDCMIRTADAAKPSRFYFRYDSIESVSALNDLLAVTPLEVVAELAEPHTYQLTPQQISTLTGENNVWTDVNGEITLTYLANA